MCLIFNEQCEGDDESPKRKEEKLKAKVWILKLSNFYRFWSIFGDEGCEIIEGKHHHWTIGGNGAVSLKGVEEGVVNT